MTTVRERFPEPMSLKEGEFKNEQENNRIDDLRWLWNE